MTNANRPRLAVLSLCLVAALVAAQPTRAESDNHAHGGSAQRVPGTDMDVNGRPLMPLPQSQVWQAPPVEQAPVYAAPPAYPAPVAHPRALNERRVAHVLQRQGFHRIRAIDVRGDRYVADARDGYGRPVRVVGSAYTGEVLNVRYR
jgi:hypothetical protein